MYLENREGGARIFHLSTFFIGGERDRFCTIQKFWREKEEKGERLAESHGGVGVQRIACGWCVIMGFLMFLTYHARGKGWS